MSKRPVRYVLALVLACSTMIGLQLLLYFERRSETQRPAPREERGEPRPVDPLPTFLAVEGVAWFAWVLVVPVLDGLVRRSTREHRAANLARHVAVVVPFALLHGAAVWTTGYMAGASQELSLLMYARRQVIFDGIIYSLLLGGFTLAESRRRHALAVETMRAQVAEARLEALRQQLNPHFLFNTLNHIVMQLRLKESDAAVRMLLTLSELLREVLADRTQLAPLSRELAIIEHYLEIERARFGARLDVSVHVEPAVTQALVPSFLLQPILENALKHGVSPADGRCEVAIDIRARGDRLCISVRDNGPGISADALGHGIGISNTRERLTHLFGKDFSLTLESVPSGGLDARLEFPLRT